MIQGSSGADADFVDFAGPLVKWREYAAIPRFGDYDALVGDEPSVPIIYDPL